MVENDILAELRVARVRAHVEHICHNIPGRLAGTTNGRRIAEYTADAMREAGVAAQVHELPGLVSFPREAQLRVEWPIELAIEANTLGHSLLTLPEGIGGEMLYVGSGGFGDYENRNAVGAITLSELSYHPARHEKQRIAALNGAIGCIMMNWGPADSTALPFGSVKPAWGNPTPETFRAEMPSLPCIGIARTAGLKLKELAAQGPVRVRFRTKVENAWRPVQITVGEIAGRCADFVIVGGHQDSWPGQQATDNAAGNACMIELARVFQKHRGELRRGLTFGFWTGHETGTMVGSSWFAERNWDRLRRHAVAYLQIDQPACVGTTRWSTASNVELRRFHAGVERRLLGDRPISWRRAVKSGDASFFGLGIPMFAGLGSYTDEELRATANANLGWWHHSLENTLDKIDWEYLALHLRVYAAYLWELCTAPILPFDFVGVAEELTLRLEELREVGAGLGIPAAISSARTLLAQCERLDRLAETWRDRYARAEVRDDAAADILNDCMKRLSRILVPVQSTRKGRYGQDPYGYTPQGGVVPVLYELPELARQRPESPARWMLETQLVQARNMVVDALEDSSRLIADCVRQLG